MDRTKVLGVVAVVVALVVAVLVRSGGGGGEDASNPNTLVGVRACLDLEQAREQLEPTDCGEAHDGQVFAKFQLGDGAWPGEIDVATLAEAGCIDRWDAAVGTNFFTDLEFDFVSLDPGEARWEAGDREVTCVLVLAGGGQMLGDQLVS